MLFCNILFLVNIFVSELNNTKSCFTSVFRIFVVSFVYHRFILKKSRVFFQNNSLDTIRIPIWNPSIPVSWCTVRWYCGISKLSGYLVFSYFIRRSSAWFSIHSSVCFYVRKAAPYSITYYFFCFYSSAAIMIFRSSASFLPIWRSFSALSDLFRLSGFPKLRSVFALLASLRCTFGAISPLRFS